MKKILKNIISINFIFAVILFVGCSNNKNTSKTESNMEKLIKETITNEIISLESVVGSGDPSGYYFDSNNKFSYYHGGYCIKNEDEIISYSGTYEIKDNSIILTFSNLKKAIGGNIVDDLIEGSCLTNYEEHLDSNEQKVILKVKKIETNNDSQTYIILEDDTIYYVLHTSQEPYKELLNT